MISYKISIYDNKEYINNNNNNNVHLYSAYSFNYALSALQFIANKYLA